MRCAVIGAGAWGSALADRLARNSHDVRIWAYEPDVVESINASHTNRFLPGVRLEPSLAACAEIAPTIRDADCIVMVAPSHVTRAVAEAAQPYVRSGALVIVASKGIEQHSLARMSEVVGDVFGNESTVALTGPSFAAEVARGLPTAVVAASTDPRAAEMAQSAFHSPVFRVYTQHDVIGAELGGAIKNVMAIATGICEGLDLGYNAGAALITRGLAEMTRLGTALGAERETFAGLAGLGDLVLTCTGSLSRNRALGIELGRGKSLDEALAGRETVAEGVITARSVAALSKRSGVRMPIVEAVFSVLFDSASPADAMTELMNRDPRPERDD